MFQAVNMTLNASRTAACFPRVLRYCRGCVRRPSRLIGVGRLARSFPRRQSRLRCPDVLRHLPVSGSNLGVAGLKHVGF